MLTIEQIIEKMKDRNAAEVARSLNISYNSVQGVLSGRFRPYETVKILSDYLEGTAEFKGGV